MKKEALGEGLEGRDGGGEEVLAGVCDGGDGFAGVGEGERVSRW